ncbi:MAG: extracellular solute-binding protein [Clostridia bacterium]|nr:extracellular solute-binding protein [Clostridia bacterium]
MKKQVLSAVLAAAFVLPIAGCGTGGKSTGETTTLRVAVFDRGNAPDGMSATENIWTNWINEQFGKPNNIKVEFQGIPRNQEVEKINMMMASRNAPDILLTYDKSVFFNYAKNGGLADLTELVGGTENLKDFMGDRWKYTTYNDKIYGVPTKVISEGQYCSYIRKDWLDKLGLEVPKTTEELYTALKAFKEKDPGNVGDGLVPFLLSATSFSEEYWQQNTLSLVMSFVEPMSEEEWYTIPQIQYPGFKEGVRYLNKLYREGILEQDFALQTNWNQFDENIAAGRAGFYTHNRNYQLTSNGAYAMLLQNDPNAELVAVDPYVNKYGKRPKWRGATGGGYIMIPSFSENIEAAVKYLDWMANNDVGFTLLNGNEDEHYKLENGYPVVIDTEYNNKTKFNNADLALIYNGFDYGSFENNVEAMRIAMPGLGELRADSMIKANSDLYNNPMDDFDQPIESYIKDKAKLDKKFQELMIKSITASESDFDSIYDGLAKEYMTIGGDEVTEERKAVYKKCSEADILPKDNPLINY